ncbi:MAG: membrane dipeptidase, partial [Caldilineaceae bacterium]|nr:membrane dipeptidase [Caldilineaceae bacterium]
MADVTYPAVFDGHNDTVLDLMSSDPERRRSFFEESPRGHIDLPRIRQGGFGGGIFAIYTPSPKRTGPPPKRNEYAVKLPDPLKYGPSLEHATRAFATLLDVEREAAGAVKVVRTADELRTCFEDGTVAMVLHLEGAEP